MGKNDTNLDVNNVTDPDAIIADMEKNGVKGPSKEEMLAEVFDDESVGMIQGIIQRVDFSGIWEKLWETNKDASMDVLGEKVAHVGCAMVQQTFIAMIPADSAAGGFVRSKWFDVILYGLLCQGIIVLCNAMIPVHPKFEYISKGAARNSINYCADALGLVSKLGKMNPLLGKFFGKA